MGDFGQFSDGRDGGLAVRDEFFSGTDIRHFIAYENMLAHQQ
jgi:hypothetical protein